MATKPVGVIKKELPPSAREPIITTREITKEPKIGTEAEAVDRVSQLKGQGYTQVGDQLRSPEIKYTKYWTKEEAERQYDTYSQHVLTLNPDGTIAKEVRQDAVQIEVSSTGGWSIRAVRPTSTQTFDYQAGVAITTPGAPPPETFMHTAQLYGRGPERAEVVAREETVFLTGPAGGKFVTAGDRIGYAAGGVAQIRGEHGELLVEQRQQEFQRAQTERLRRRLVVERLVPKVARGVKDGRLLQDRARDRITPIGPSDDSLFSDFMETPTGKALRGAGELIVAPFRGAGKVLLSEAQARQDLLRAVIDPSRQKELFPIARLLGTAQRRAELMKEPDVQAFITVAGTSALIALAPITAIPIGAAVTGLGAYEIYKGKVEEDYFRIGAGAVMLLGGLPLGKRFLPKVKTTKLPLVKKEAVVTILVFERGPKAKPIVSRIKTPEGVRYEFGVPDISPELVRLRKGAEIKPATATETLLLEKGLQRLPETMFKEPARAREAIGVGRTILARTKGVPSRFIDEARILETERLPRRGVEVVLEVAKEEQAVVFGSVARKLQVPKEISEFIPRDIDIRLRDTSEPYLSQVIETTVGRMRARGLTVRRSPKITEAIEIKTPEGWIKALEYKGPGGLLEGEAVPDLVLGFTKEGKPITLKKQQFTPLEEELRGVMQGVVRVREEGGLLDVYPPAKRTKDIGSVMASAETLARSKLIPDPTLRASITRFEELFRPQEFRGKGETMVKLADFSPVSPFREMPSAVGFKFVNPYISEMFPERSPFDVASVISERPSVASVISERPSVASASVISTPSVSEFASPKPAVSPPSGYAFPSPKETYFPESPYPSPKEPSPYYGLPSPSEYPSVSPPISPLGYPSPTDIPSVSPIIEGLEFPKEPAARRRIPMMFDRDKPRKQEVYHTLVREAKPKGKGRISETRVTDKPLPYNKALNAGDYYTDETSARTFRVISAGQSKKEVSDDALFYDRYKYRIPKGQSKLNPKSFVEKSLYALDSAGERREITAKGLKALERKRRGFVKRLF